MKVIEDATGCDGDYADRIIFRPTGQPEKAHVRSSSQADRVTGGERQRTARPCVGHVASLVVLSRLI